MPTEAERAEYFRTHDENGNLIIPNEFAAPSIPGTGVKLDEPKAYNLPYEYSLPRLGAAGIEALTTLGTGALAYPLGAVYGLGSNLLSGKYGTAEGARLADEEAAKAAEAMTYIPRTKTGQQAVEGLGDIFEALKIPPIIPELAGLQGMRRPLPDDVRAMGGKGLELAEDIRNLKDDYLNAQEGITRERPTLGASLQRKAKTLGDYVAERQANEREFRQNYSLMPSMAEAGKSYAVFPKGTPKRNVIKPSNIKLETDEQFNPWFRSIKPIIKQSPEETISNYTQGPLARLYGVDDTEIGMAWYGFKQSKAQEMYPDLSRPSAIDAFDKKYKGNASEKNEILLGWLDEFSNTNELGLPPLSVLKENEDKAMKVAQQTLPNMFASMIGQEDKDFPVKFSMEGLNIEDPAELLLRYRELSPTRIDQLIAAREKAGLPPEGIAQKTIDEINKNIESVDNELAELTQNKWAMEEQWTDRDNQPAPEGYKELTRRETKLTDEKKRLQKRAKAMEAAPALEAFHDLSMSQVVEKPSALKDAMLQQDYQFYPQLDYKKDPETGAYLLRTDEQGALKPELVTPESESIVIPRLSWAAGFRDAMHKYIEDIQKGKTDKSPEQYYLREAQAKGKEREDKAALEAKRQELSKQNYMSYVDAAPADKVFGDYAAIEFTPAMSPEELGKGLSIDTDVLNHCVASGDRQNSRHVGIWDPATGKIRDGMRSEISSEMRDIIDGDAYVTSIRDRRTGLPVITIKLKPSSQNPGKFSLGYVSGERNDKMDLKANYAVRDYLNSRADEIVGGNYNLMDNADIYDLKDEDQRIRVASKVGTGTRQSSIMALQDYLSVNPDTPRFATGDDVRAMISPKSTAVTATPFKSLITQEEVDRYIADMGTDAQREALIAIHQRDTNTGAPGSAEEWTDHLMSMADRVQDIVALREFARAQLEIQRATPARSRMTEPTGEEIIDYINTMEEDDVVMALVDGLGMNEELTRRQIQNDPVSVYESEDLGGLIYTHLMENPEILESIRDANGWEPEPPMTLPAGDPMENLVAEYYQASTPDATALQQIRRNGPLTAQILDNANPMIIPFTEAESAQEIASTIARVNSNIPPDVIADLMVSRVRAEEVFGVRGLPDDLIHNVGAALREMQAPAQVAAPTEPIEGILEAINMTSDPGQLRQLQVAMDNSQLRTRYTPEQFDEVNRTFMQRRAQLFNERAANYTQGNVPQEEAADILELLPLHLADMSIDSTHPLEAADTIQHVTGFEPSLLMADVVAQAPERFGLGTWTDNTVQEVAQIIRDRMPRRSLAQDFFEMINEARDEEQVAILRNEFSGRRNEFTNTESQMLLEATRDRRRALRSVPESEQVMLEAVTEAPSLGSLSTLQTVIDSHRYRYNDAQWATMQRAIERQRQALAPARPAPPLIPAFPEDVEAVLQDLESHSEQALTSYAADIQNNPQGLTDDQVQEVVTAIEYELARRRGDEDGLAEGGVVNMSEGGLWEGYGAPMGESPNYYREQEDSPVHSRSNLNYGNRKYSNADVNWNEISTDVDLLNKYGVGATKQSSVVKLHNDKIKQSDISELRARYATDDGTQYAVSRRPLDRTWSVRRSEPRDQSSLSVDISPDYKGISYTKNFAEGGAVYDHESVSSMADELLGSMNFAEGGPALSVGRGEKLPVSRGAGLTAKGRAKANRATGSNLKAPAPHPKTEADANRRKSFCARMSGMPGPMKDDNGNPTRKAASLKRWNC
jgi:hypothetical protein